MSTDKVLEEAVLAYGRASLRNVRLEADNQDLKRIIDQLRADLHMRDIEIHTLKEQKYDLVRRNAELYEKAETRTFPTVAKPEDDGHETDELPAMEPTIVPPTDALIL